MIKLLCIALSILRVYSETGPSVKTNCGTVIGVYSYSRNDRLYSSFYSVPYAVSPIKNLRFEPRQKITNCPDVINATTEGPPCWQPNMLFPDDKNPFIGSEDCLTLSIYTPQVEDCGLLPVMVYFIEGGYTINGAAEGLHGPSYLMDEDIVLVMSNNRLNVFGYLSTEDHVVPGNMALKDQVAVLRYVKENIIKFGGDPDQVTLFGLSSGATTSALHMRSTLSKVKARMDSCKRKNISQEERLFILEMVNMHKNILENKKTDAISTDQKRKKWQEICLEFNKVPEHNKKNVEQIKKVWDNEKTRRKKELANEKRELYRTGGGPFLQCVTTYTPEIDETLGQVDIELKDALDSDSIALSSLGCQSVNKSTMSENDHLLSSGIVMVEEVVDLDNSVEADSPRPKPSASARARVGDKIKTSTKFDVINKEGAWRIKRVQALIKQDLELHNLKMEQMRLVLQEQALKVQLTEIQLKKEKAENC